VLDLTVRVKVVFTGPLKREYGPSVELEVKEEITLGELLDTSFKQLLRDGSPRADLLFLINGVDSEIKGGSEAKLNEGDTLTVVPIAHGG